MIHLKYSYKLKESVYKGLFTVAYKLTNSSLNSAGITTSNNLLLVLYI